MLLSGIRNNLFPKNNKIAAVILLCVYAYMCGTHLIEATDMEINLSEYLLCCITDHYYLMYALLVYLIIDSAIRIKGTLENAKIRYKTLSLYYGGLIITRFANLFILVLAHLLIPLIIGATRLDFSFGYTIMYSKAQFNSNYEVINVLAELFPNSTLAILCVTVYLFLGISFISIFSALIFEILGQKGFVASVAVILLNTFIGFVSNLDEGAFKFFFLNDYFIFHHGIINNCAGFSLLYIFIIALVIIVLFRIAIRHNSNRDREHKNYTMNLYYHPVIIGLFYFVYCGLAYAMSINGSDAFTWLLLKGFSYLQFNVVELLFYIAPIMFSLFFVNMEWENELKDRNLLALIRYGKIEKWEKEKIISEVLFITANVLIVVTVSFFSVAFSTQKIDSMVHELSLFYNLKIDKIFACSILCLLFRCIEWILFYVIDKTIFNLSNNTIVSYLITIAFIFIGFIRPTLNPIGKGSLYQLLEIGDKSILSFVTMVIIEILITIVLFSKNKHIKENSFHGNSNQIRKRI